jgi:transposase
MPRHPNYSREFKDAIVSKIVNRGNQTVAQVCEAEGIGKATAANWLKSANMLGMSKKNKKKKWSPNEKLKAVSETIMASEAEIGAYLRKEGLHSQQLKEWQDQALASLAGPLKSSDGKSERERELMSQVADLEKEVARKDKALSEASTLLILQKKVQLIWDRKEEK